MYAVFDGHGQFGHHVSSVLQRVAVCCSVLHCVAVFDGHGQFGHHVSKDGSFTYVA